MPEYDNTCRLNARVPIKFLPRESRALFVLQGVELSGAGMKQNKIVLSWGTLNLFNSKGFVILLLTCLLTVI